MIRATVDFTMRSKKVRLLILGSILVMSLMVFVATTFAATTTFTGTITTADLNAPWFGCAGPGKADLLGPLTATVSGSYSFTPNGAPQPIDGGVGSFWLTINHNTYDLNNMWGPSLGWIDNNPTTVNGTVSMTAGDAYYIIVQDCGAATNHGPVSYSFSANGPGMIIPLTSPSAAGDGVLLPPDARINWRYGDLWAVLYRNIDTDGAPSIDVYCYSGERGVWDFSATSETASGTHASGCNVTFYILSDGSFQFNILVPEGKEYTVNCADLACADPQLSRFDPGE